MLLLFFFVILLLEAIVSRSVLLTIDSISKKAATSISLSYAYNSFKITFFSPK